MLTKEEITGTTITSMIETVETEMNRMVVLQQ